MSPNKIQNIPLKNVIRCVIALRIRQLVSRDKSNSYLSRYFIDENGRNEAMVLFICQHIGSLS